jgi:L,D-transpeptidase ErfK/SrfK
MRQSPVRLTVVVCALLAVCAASVSSQPAAAIVGSVFVRAVTQGESWQSLGARFGVDPSVLAADNMLTMRRPLVAGVALTIDNRHIVPGEPNGIVINIPQRMLFLKTGGELVANYPVGLGKPGWPTFIGPFTVMRVETDPVWDVPPSIQEEQRRAGKKVITRVLPGPANPLGKFYLGLSAPNFGIHGTIAPLSIYRFESHGCIRLHPDDIADLWPRVAVGTPGAIVYEPLLVTVDASGAVLLEAHRDIYRRDTRDSLQVVRDRASGLGVSDRIDWTAVRAALQVRHGRPSDITAP